MTLAEGLVGAISKTKEGQIHTFPLQEADMQVAGVLDSNQIPIVKVEVAGDLVVGSVEGMCRNTYFGSHAHFFASVTPPLIDARVAKVAKVAKGGQCLGI